MREIDSEGCDEIWDLDLGMNSYLCSTSCNFEMCLSGPTVSLGIFISFAFSAPKLSQEKVIEACVWEFNRSDLPLPHSRRSARPPSFKLHLLVSQTIQKVKRRIEMDNRDPREAEQKRTHCGDWTHDLLLIYLSLWRAFIGKRRSYGWAKRAQNIVTSERSKFTVPVLSSKNYRIFSWLETPLKAKEEKFASKILRSRTWVQLKSLL